MHSLQMLTTICHVVGASSALRIYATSGYNRTPATNCLFKCVFLPHHMGFDHTATNGGWRPSYFKSIVSNLNQTTEPPIYLPPRIVDELIFVIIIFTTCFVTTVVLFSVSLFFRPPLTSPIDIGGDVENDEQLVLLLLRSQKSTNFFIVSVEVLF